MWPDFHGLLVAGLTRFHCISSHIAAYWGWGGAEVVILHVASKFMPRKPDLCDGSVGLLRPVWDF